MHASTPPDPPPAAEACGRCGTRLLSAVCPACALRGLLEGAPSPEEPDGNGQEERYRLKRRLAAGGMGVVYEAEDRRLHRTVALKMIRGSSFANDSELARFTLEAEAVALLDHPDIVPVYEIGRLEGQPFFTMKWIDGGSLAERLSETGGRLPVREAAGLVGRIARAVHHAHQRGVLHRDLKPGNVLIDGTGKPWLTDFGLAKMADQESGLTLTSDQLGTPHYMPPEAAGGRAREASTAGDVWSLGVMLWSMLAGKPPFHGQTPAEILRRIEEREPEWPQGLRQDRDLMTVLHRCLEKDPARRMASAGDLAAELDRWERGEPILSRPVRWRERIVKWARRAPAQAALAVVMAAALAGGAGLWLRAERAVVSLKESNRRLGEALDRSTALKLAGDARRITPENAARGLLMAVEAVEMTESTLGAATPEAVSALTAVLQVAGGRDASVDPATGEETDAYIQSGDWYGRDVQVSPDGRWLLSLKRPVNSATLPTRAVLFDLSDETRDDPVSRWDFLPPGPVSEVFDWCWLSDSRRVLAVQRNGAAGIWQVSAGKPDRGSPLADPLPVYSSIGSLAEPGQTLHRITVAPPSHERPVRIAIVYRHAEKNPEFLGRTAELTTENALLAGPLHRLTPDGILRPRSWQSPDGRWALFTAWDEARPVVLTDLSLPDAAPVVLSGDPAIVRRIAWTADSRQMAVCLSDGRLVLWSLPAPGDAGARPLPRELPRPPGVTERLAFSPDGQWLACAGDSGAVLLYPLARDGSPVTRRHTGGRGFGLTFSPDSRHLALGAERKVVFLWNLDSLPGDEPPLELRGIPGAALNVGFSPDGRTLHGSWRTGIAWRWRFDGRQSGAQPDVLPGATGPVHDMAASPDGEWIALANRADVAANPLNSQGTVTLVPRRGNRPVLLTSHAAAATGVAFSRDGAFLASTGWDGTVKVWDTAETFPAARNGTAVPAPRFTLTMPGTRLEYDRRVAFHPRGILYAVCGDGWLFEWDLTLPDPAGGVKKQLIHSISFLLPAIAVSPDGHWLAVARHGWDSEPVPGSRQSGNQVLLFDVSQPGPPRPVTQWAAHFIRYTQLAFSPDSRYLAAGSSAGGPQLWDLAAADIPASMRRAFVNTTRNIGIAFSPDGHQLAVGGLDGRLHLWDLKDSNGLRTIESGHPVEALLWTRDNLVIAPGARDSLTLWDTDVSRLKTLARRTAGRPLLPSEKNSPNVSPQP